MHAPAHRARTIGATLMVAIALSLLLASSALATPSDQTLGLTALQTKLDASGTVDGYMKTVVKGSTVITIPVTVESITEGPYFDYPVILFQATGTLMTQYGGIVDGMSGSPIYVDDQGTDKVIGAVSFGEEYTLARPDRKSTRLNSSHSDRSRMPSSA